MTTIARTKQVSPYAVRALARWRKRLLTMKRALTEDLARLSPQAFSDETPGRADPAIAAQPHEIVIAEMNETREMIGSIDQAIARIDGEARLPFGVCERTGMVIEPERLDLIPWTTLSTLGARLVERESARAV